jgi:hypothetical protein
MRTKTDMKRKNFYLSKREIESLESKSKKIGISVSELLRRIIDSYFENTK